MYSIEHVTLLEKFRRVVAAGDSNTWDTEQSLYEGLAGLFDGNEKTRIGSAFHRLVELGAPEKIITYQDREYHISMGHAFTEEQAQVAYSHKQSFPQMFCEVPISKVYDTPYGKIRVSGTVDGLDGAQVRDTKLKFKAFSAQDYLDSFQWRIYSDILGVKIFYYDVFEVKGMPKDGLGSPVEIDGEYILLLDSLRLVPHEPISCFAYPTMKQDIYELICAFAEWIQTRNYWHLLKPRNDQGHSTSKAAEGGSQTSPAGTEDAAEATPATEASGNAAALPAPAG